MGGCLSSSAEGENIDKPPVKGQASTRAGSAPVPAASCATATASLTQELAGKQAVANAKAKWLKGLDAVVMDTTLETLPESSTAERLLAVLAKLQSANVSHFLLTPRLLDKFAASKAQLPPGCCALAGLLPASADTAGLLPKKLASLKEQGLQNVVLEYDAADKSTSMSTSGVAELMLSSFKEAVTAFGAPCWLLVQNFFSEEQGVRENILQLVELLAQHPELRPQGLLMEDAKGMLLPFCASPRVAAVRRTLLKCGWRQAHMLVRPRHNFGVASAFAMECLAAGCDGVWTGVTDEGPDNGLLSYLVVLFNLARLGNQRVKKRFKLPELRKATLAIILEATGKEPHPMSEVYGARAFDVCWDPAMGGTNLEELKMLGLDESLNRISTLSTTDMICTRLKQTFGDNEGKGYTVETAQKMIEVLHHDLLNGEKEEYDSPWGLSTLFERATGAMTQGMVQLLSRVQAEDHPLIQDVKLLWEEWESQQRETGEGALPAGSLGLTAFYHGFLARYFSCFTCDVTAQAFAVFDVGGAGCISWEWFLMRLSWALLQFEGSIKSSEDLIKTVFEKLIIPQMLLRLKSKHGGGKANGQAPEVEGVDGIDSSAMFKAKTMNRTELYEEWKDPAYAKQQVGVNIPVKGML